MPLARPFNALSGFMPSLSSFHSLQEEHTMAYAIVDHELRLLKCNTPASKYISKTTEAGYIIDLVPLAFKEDLLTILEKALKTKSTQVTKARSFYDGTGKKYFLRMQASLLSTIEKETYLIYFEKIDIDEGSETKDLPPEPDNNKPELKSSGTTDQDDKFRLIFENAPVGTAIVSAENKISMANKAFCRLVGYHQQEIIHLSLETLCSPEDFDRLSSKQAKLEEGAIEDFQITKDFISKSGQRINTILKMSLLPLYYGSSDRYLLQVIDISSRKEYEEHLIRRNEHLEKMNAQLDSFVYSASHDLRAPLRSILGLVYIIQQEKGSEPFHVYLDMMISSINRLDRFIRDVIDHSRNARLAIQNTKIDLHLLVSEILEDLQYINGADKIQKIIEVDNSQEMYSDVSRLKVVLSNLIANAMTYHNLRQENPFVKVTLTFNDSRSIITVEDNGRGIPEEYHQKIFEMFFRASEDTTGSGLGLYIVKEAVEKLGGTISLHSVPNQGTTFTVIVPNINDNSK